MKLWKVMNLSIDKAIVFELGNDGFRKVTELSIDIDPTKLINPDLFDELKALLIDYNYEFLGRDGFNFYLLVEKKNAPKDKEQNWRENSSWIGYHPSP